MAVWAHPFWDIEDEDEVLAAIDRYREAGLDGVEVFYTTHTRAAGARCSPTAARELGLLTTGSSDYHGPDHRLFSSFRASTPTTASPTSARSRTARWPRPRAAWTGCACG